MKLTNKNKHVSETFCGSKFGYRIEVSIQVKHMDLYSAYHFMKKLLMH